MEENQTEVKEYVTEFNAEGRLPLYTCHKKVRAAKITEIVSHEDDGIGSHTMIFGEIGEKMFLTHDWKEKFNPAVGGYYVKYKDGYSSFSPGEAFEDGYSEEKEIPIAQG